MWPEIILFIIFFLGMNAGLEIEERIKHRKRKS